MNGFDSEEQLTKHREVLEDTIQATKALRKGYERMKFWDNVINAAAVGFLVFALGYLVYTAIGG